MPSWLIKFAWDDSGQDLIEYSFLMVFIALVVAVGLSELSGNMNGQMTNISNQVGT